MSNPLGPPPGSYSGPSVPAPASPAATPNSAPAAVAGQDPRDQQIQALRQQIAQKDQELANLKPQVAQVPQLTAQLQQYAAATQQRDQQIAALTQEREGMAQNIGQLQANIQQVSGQMAQMQDTMVPKEQMEQAMLQVAGLQGQLATSAQSQANSQAQMAQMQEAMAAKDRLIAELKTPSAVMPSQLSMGATGMSGMNTSYSAPAPAMTAVAAAPIGNRRVCQQCGSTKIAEVEDKSVIIAYAPKVIYGKSNKCTDCGFKW